MTQPRRAGMLKQGVKQLFEAPANAQPAEKNLLRKIQLLAITTTEEQRRRAEKSKREKVSVQVSRKPPFFSQRFF